MNKHVEVIKERDSDMTNTNIEEEINKRALKIGRKVLDEICLHDENTIEVQLRKSDVFSWYVVEVGVHLITGLFDTQIKFIKEEGLREEKLNAFDIKEKEKE